ncbi:hypothetical protein VDG1235_1217 [Verrucomicrobiia bacterium DG1235]|nr:hypothetical protein VDG1235_1217 [Verrucomicrobiae bacterium DG1235]
MSTYKNPSLTPYELAEQIRLFISENRKGQAAARLAWRFSRAIENAKLDLDEIKKLIRDRNTIEAFLLAHTAPAIAEVVKELTLPESTNWKLNCEAYQRCVPSSLDPVTVTEIEDEFPPIREREEWLLDEYRSRKESGQLAESYPIIRYLSKQPSSSLALKSEQSDVKTVLIQQASTQLSDLLKQEANSSLISNELDYFRSYDLEINSNLGPVFENALSIERTRQKALAFEKVQNFLQTVETADLDGLNWISHENLYFTYDGLINRQELKWILPNELIKNFSLFAERLSDLRLAFENNITSPTNVVIPADNSHKAEPEAAETDTISEKKEEEEKAVSEPVTKNEDSIIQEPEPAIEANPVEIPEIEKPELDCEPTTVQEKQPDAAETKPVQEAEEVAPAIEDIEPANQELESIEEEKPTPTLASDTIEDEANELVETEPTSIEDEHTAEPAEQSATVEEIEEAPKNEDSATPSNIEEPASPPNAKTQEEKQKKATPEDVAAQEVTTAEKEPVSVQTKSADPKSSLPKFLTIGLPIGTAAAIYFFVFTSPQQPTPSETVAAQEVQAPQPVAEPQIKIIEAKAYNNPSYNAYLTELTEILESKFDLQKIEEAENLLAKIDHEIGGMPIKEADKATVTFNSLKIATKALQREFLSKLLDETNSSYDLYENCIETLSTSIGRDNFQDLETAALEAKNIYIERVEEIRSFESSSAIKSHRSLDMRFEDAKRLHTSILTERASLIDSSSLEQFYAKLDSLAKLPNNSTEENQAIAKAADLAANLSNSIADLRSIPIASDSVEFAANAFDQSTPVSLEFIEEALLDNMIRVAQNHSEVYQATEVYYKGKSEPYSETKILISGPPIVTEQESQATTQIHPFKKNGSAFASPVSKNYMVDQFNNPWGYKYKEAKTTPEGEFSKNYLTPKLENLASQPEAFAVLSLVDSINERTDLSVSYRAFWIQKLYEFSSERPWHWKQALSPSFRTKGKQLQAMDVAAKGDWIREALDESYSTRKFEPIVSSLGTTSAEKEAQAIIALWEFSKNCEFEPIGYVSRDGVPAFANSESIENKTLWTLNSENQTISRLSAALATSPYNPILSASYAGVDSAEFIENLNNELGTDLSQEGFTNLIPKLFQSSK